MSLARELRVVEAFADLDDGELGWLAEHARVRTVEPGDAVFHEGDVPDAMLAVLDGEIRMTREHGPPDGPVIMRPAGKITGMLPFSRLSRSPVTGRATARTRVAFFATELFPAMLQRIPALQTRLASVMVDRSREFTRHAEQRERLVSLGKLSAGLAHELNNPAASIQRRAEALSMRLKDLGEVAWSLLEREAEPARLAALTPAPAAGGPIDTLARSEAEEALARWLEGRHAGDAWLAADTFVAAGLTPADLERATDGLPQGKAALALRLLEADLASRRLADDIAEAARRIAELIAAVKSYSNMDRAPVKADIDVHDGIMSTLTMLAHKLRDKEVTVERDFDPTPPRVRANPGELNQVWTNLLDNAIDAVPAGGTVTIRTSHDDARLSVQVIDNGAGIPPEVKGRIFDPFFTSKGVGEGTGLGLDIVRRILHAHDADVHVESVPGRTCFEVRLPLAASGADAAPE